MSFREANEKYGKLFLILASLMVGIVVVVLFKIYGYDRTWELWRVPVEHPQFLDFRLIPGSAESFRRGYEPTQENPDDPVKRIFNYPVFWRLFFYTKITQDDTVWIVLVMLVLFFISVFSFPQNITILDSICLLFLVFSPAAMLLYERGNVDLIVFFLCVITVFAANYSSLIASTLLIFATIVKLYPFFGITIFFRETKSRFIIFSLACFGVLIVYLFTASRSVAASWNWTMRGEDISYGANVLFFRYRQFFSEAIGISQNNPLLKYGPLFLAFVLMLVAGVIGTWHHDRLISPSLQNLTAFRMGASIYAGTFLLGNNWDYRLAFLILCMPQVLYWSRQALGHHRFLSRIALVLIYACCWHFMVWYAPSLAGIREFLFVADEIFNWLLLVCFGYLLFASAPEWMREYMLLFSKKHSYQRA
jgi:hypothetical protein